METVTHCPICGNTDFAPFLTCKDYLVSQTDFAIQQCTQCGFRLTNPRPSASEISQYYDSDQYVSHHDSGEGLLNVAYKLVRTYTLRSKQKLITDINGGLGKLLDVGCGTGDFLAACKKGGWTISGFEPDADARRVASQKTGIEISSSLEQVKDNAPFDVVTLWHVLEHIPDLNETIQTLRSLLSDDGTLLIAVPNSDSLDAQEFGPYWAAYDVPRHLYHFTPTTMERLLRKHHMRLIRKLPMMFDAFYIALLSTKYKIGQTQYIESVSMGVRSNLHAYRQGDSSSQIFLFKKA